MGKPSQSVAYGIIAAYILYGLGCGYMAATQPIGAGWRLFSYHPFLMTLGMITCLGSASIIKKLGGYYNTKMHGVLSWCGLMASLGGLYAIWLNKNNLGRSHLKTNHSLLGLACFLLCFALGVVGGAILHPDWGIDNKNKTIRTAHKLASRFTLALTWFAAFLGLQEMTQDTTTLALFGLPLLIFAPMSLI